MIEDVKYNSEKVWRHHQQMMDDHEQFDKIIKHLYMMMHASVLQQEPMPMNDSPTRTVTSLAFIRRINYKLPYQIHFNTGSTYHPTCIRSLLTSLVIIATCCLVLLNDFPMRCKHQRQWYCDPQVL